MQRQEIDAEVLLSRMRQELTLRAYTEATSRTYVNATANLFRWLERNNRGLSRQGVVDYLIHVARERGVAPSSQHTYLMSIRFLCRRVLHRPELVAGIPQPKVRSHPPIVPSRSQVRALLLNVERARFRLMLMFAGFGWRRSAVYW